MSETCNTFHHIHNTLNIMNTEKKTLHRSHTDITTLYEQMYLRQILLAQRTVGVVVQTAFQTFEAEGVSTGSGHRLVKQSGRQMSKSTQQNANMTNLHTLI